MLRLPPTPPGDHFVRRAETDRLQTVYPLQVCACHACGHAQLTTVVPPAEIYTRYLYTTQSSPGLAEYFEKAAQTIRTHVNLSNDSLVVDIGSNDGTLLKAFQPYARVLGVDPAKHIADAATSAGIPTLCDWWCPDTADVIRNTHGRAQLITATNVIANVDILGMFLEAVMVLLAEDGVFVLETGYWPAIVSPQNLLIDTIEHEHLSYFTVRSLQTLCDRYGLTLFHVEETPSKGGSIRGYAHRRRSFHEHVPSVDVALQHERRRLFEASVLQQRVTEWCEVLHDVVYDCAKMGRTVYGYGASVGGTTLLYAAGLNQLVSVILDDNPQRHGLFTPGWHLPVRPSSEIHEADDVVVLAWRYADRIRAQHPDFLGRFLIPLPDVRFVSHE